MSRYHAGCSEQDPTKKPPNRLLTTKPFCDCRRCTCHSCPDILHMLSITVTDSTCHFGSKVKSKDKIPEAYESAEPPNLLDVINPDRDCSCDVVARGVRDHVHMNLGLSERRSKITNFTDVCNEQCRANLPEDPKSAQNTKSVTTKTITVKDSKMSTRSKDRPKCRLCDSVPRR